VALFDIAKGAIPVLFFSGWAGAAEHPWLPTALGGAAVLGHMFSPYVSFKGGKGVATAAGMFLALAPVAVLLAISVWGICLWLTGYVSLSSIIAVLSVPLSVALLQPAGPYVFWASVALVALIVFTHRRNIRRLLAGTENRFRTRSNGPSGRPAVGPSE
jgi:glycerol-3-phosphate acyltransferase PlsY